MNLVLLTEQDYNSSDTVVLRDQRFTHITQVHRAVVGDTLRVGLLGGLCGHGRVEAIDSNSLSLRVELDTPPPAKLPLCLILALPRPKMLRRILRNVAELGIPRLILINSYRVEKSYWGSPALTPENLRTQLIHGLQQARDTQLPKVELKSRFKPFVEDELPAIADGQQAVVAHPGSGNDTICKNSSSVLAIGPEGGFIDYELGKFADAGFQNLDFGPRIYRVENAVTLGVARLFQ